MRIPEVCPSTGDHECVSFSNVRRTAGMLQRKIKGVGRWRHSLHFTFLLLPLLLLVEVGDVKSCVGHKIGHRHVGQLGPELGQHGVLLLDDLCVDPLQPKSSLHGVATGAGRVVRPVEPIHKEESVAVTNRITVEGVGVEVAGVVIDDVTRSFFFFFFFFFFLKK